MRNRLHIESHFALVRYISGKNLLSMRRVIPFYYGGQDGRNGQGIFESDALLKSAILKITASK